MSTLYLIQYACLLISAINMILLIASRIFIKWTNRKYEKSRWILASTMMLLVIHFTMQMKFGLRAQGDDVGATFNILFYMPSAALLTYSLLNIESTRRARRIYRNISIACYITILATFLSAHLQNGSLHIGKALNVMYALNQAFMIFFTIAYYRAIKQKKVEINDNIGGDITPYVTYTHTGFFILSSFTLIATSLILFRPLLLVFAPFVLLALLFFVMTFIAFGFNLSQYKEILNEDDQEAGSANSPSEKTDVAMLTDEKIEKIDAALQNWHNVKGYSNSDITITELSRIIGFSRDDLKFYLDLRYQCTFRIWLSNLRFEAAKKLMVEHPEYSNETISMECGLSSRAQLYNVFRTNTGMTPKEWKKRMDIK